MNQLGKSNVALLQGVKKSGMGVKKTAVLASKGKFGKAVKSGQKTVGAVKSTMKPLNKQVRGAKRQIKKIKHFFK